MKATAIQIKVRLITAFFFIIQPCFANAAADRGTQAFNTLGNSAPSNRIPLPSPTPDPDPEDTEPDPNPTPDPGDIKITPGEPGLGNDASQEIYPDDDSDLILENGDFSVPDLNPDDPSQPNAKYHFETFSNVEGWTAISGSLVEIQNTASEPDQQYCELDSDWPGQRGQGDSDHGIQQYKDLKRGNYLLVFDYRGRTANDFHNQSVTANSIMVKADPNDGPETTLVEITNASTTEWKRALVPFQISDGPPDTDTEQVKFKFDIPDGKADSVGPLIDNVILIPLDITVKKASDSDPDPEGVLIKAGGSLALKLTEFPEAQFPIPHDKIVWYSQQIQQDGNFTGWAVLGGQAKGVTCTYIPPTGGIFQLKATLSYNGKTQDVQYLRHRDEPNATEGGGTYSPTCKQGQPDYFGVAQTNIQMAVRQTAHDALGRIDFAKEPAKVFPTDAPTPFNSFTILAKGNKCNGFVYLMANQAGAYVPLTHYSTYTVQGVTLTTPFATNPPLAYDWYDSSYLIAGWNILSSSVYPQPGFVVSRPDSRVINPGPDYGKHWAHVGILDYDGCWIQAGSITVNKYPHLEDPEYQPIRMRNFSGN